MKRFAIFVLALVAGTASVRAAEDSAESADPRAQSSLPSPSVARVMNESAPLIVWNRHVADFRVTYDNWDPAERARRAVERILAVPAERGIWVVDHGLTQVGELHGFLFTINGEFAFRLVDGDIDTESGETLEQAALRVEASLREVMESRSLQRTWPVILRGVGLSIAMTIALVASLIIASRLRHKIQDRLRPLMPSALSRVVVGGINVWPILGGLRQMLAKILTWAVGGGLIYIWLALVLEQFPYTEPWGDALGGFVIQVLANIGSAILWSIPDLFAVAVIFALTHAFVRGVGAYFLAVEREEVSVSWLGGETARATRQLLTILIWGFALVLAYPHIPGSDTDAFKGVTVLLGLMVSLGSAGLVNHIMSGLTVIYSNAYHRGDFVKIGDHDGRVTQVGLLSTKIEKSGGEIVSVPNAVVTATTTTNFSPGGRAASEILATSVTIGYDAPWRQVYELLRLAAKRIPELAQEPAPFVLQRALSDYYVEYQLVTYLTRRERRGAALSRLHAEIQDAFNEHGVQIMSPHFEAQPDEPVIVPRTAWFTRPAEEEQRT